MLSARRWQQDGETLVDWDAPTRKPRSDKGVSRPHALRRPARHDDPDFVPSLRLLVCRERYSLQDIGMMFGVSRERVRQWCVKYRIDRSDYAWATGLHAIRMWDDNANRFIPFSKAMVREAERAHLIAEARDLRGQRRIARQARIATILKALKETLGRDPTGIEMREAIGAKEVTTNLGSWLVNMWDARGCNRGSKAERSARYARIMREIGDATGIQVRGRGSAGHIDPTGAPRKETCIRGHSLRETRHPRNGYCVECRKIRNNAAYRLSKQGAA